MAKKTTNEVAAETVSEDTPFVPQNNVAFSQEQLAIVNSMIAQAVRSSARTDSSVSVYGQRDPKSIERVNVKRMNGKFVIGFKNLQNDPLRMDVPKYLEYKFDPIRKLNEQPFITLILSDGKETEEKEILLADYYRHRDYFEAKVTDIKVEKEVVDDGVLGRGGNTAREVDEKNNPVARTKIKAESIKEKRTYMVELPGFEKSIAFNQDFLA